MRREQKEWSTTLSERGPKLAEVDMELRQDEIQTTVHSKDLKLDVVFFLNLGKVAVVCRG